MVYKLNQMKTIKITHWIFTLLFSALMLFSASMYFFNYEAMVEAFGNFNFPTWIIYPLATLKILGVLTIVLKFKDWVVEFAYAGFYFNVLLAFGAHVGIGDGEQGGAIMAFVLLTGSFITYRLMKRAM